MRCIRFHAPRRLALHWHFECVASVVADRGCGVYQVWFYLQESATRRGTLLASRHYTYNLLLLLFLLLLLLLLLHHHRHATQPCELFFGIGGGKLHAFPLHSSGSCSGAPG